MYSLEYQEFRNDSNLKYLRSQGVSTNPLMNHRSAVPAFRLHNLQNFISDSII